MQTRKIVYDEHQNHEEGLLLNQFKLLMDLYTFLSGMKYNPD